MVRAGLISGALIGIGFLLNHNKELASEGLAHEEQWKYNTRKHNMIELAKKNPQTIPKGVEVCETCYQPRFQLNEDIEVCGCNPEVAKTQWNTWDFNCSTCQIMGKGKYRFNQYGRTGFAHRQYRFQTKDAAIDFLSWSRPYPLRQVKPNNPQYEVRDKNYTDCHNGLDIELIRALN